MFKRDDIITLLRADPFKPFNLYVSNGEVFDIRHPDMALPTIEWMHVAVPPATNPDGFERFVILQLAHIVKMETYSPPVRSIPDPTAA